MKKILFILPILIVVLTGCTYSKQVTNNTSFLNSKNYTNERYGYSVYYPSNWTIITEEAENDFKTEDNGYNRGGKVIFAERDYRNDPLIWGGIPSASLMLDIYKINKEFSIEKFTSDNDWFKYESSKPLTINGIEVLEFTHPNIHPSSHSLFTVFKKNDKVYVFSSVGIPNSPDTNTKYQQIINSFTIIK